MSEDISTAHFAYVRNSEADIQSVWECFLYQLSGNRSEKVVIIWHMSGEPSAILTQLLNPNRGFWHKKSMHPNL